MAILCANLALGLDAIWPDDHEWIGGTAAVGFALPATKRRVAGVRPAPRIMIEVLRPAQIVYCSQVLLQVVRHIVKEFSFIHRAVRAALGARAIVRDHHDQGIVVFAY